MARTTTRTPMAAPITTMGRAVPPILRLPAMAIPVAREALRNKRYRSQGLHLGI